jgi:putative NADPH-quinone reductase
MQVQIETGILGYCGIRTVSAHIFHDVDTDAEARQAHLLRARALGKAFPAEPPPPSAGSA